MNQMERIVSKKIKADLNNLIFRFERDFPDEYGSLCELLERKFGSTRLADDEDFRCELGDIVYSYGRNHPREEYRKSAHQLADDIKDLIDKLSATLHAMSKLDGVYNQRIVDFMVLNPLFDEPNYNLGHVLRDLENARLTLSFLRLALHFAMHFEAKPTGRSRPPLPHYVPTVRFMDLWERYTQTKVVAPKGAATGKRKSQEATQPSTEFVRLGLKMIDTNISPANTMTLIKRVLADRKKCKGKSLTVLIATPELQDLLKVWKKWEKEYGSKSSPPLP
jgi:hypothetical protein